MSTTVTALTLDGLDKLPTHTRRCVFWELDPAVARQTREFADPVFEKEAWLSTVMLEWGSCGQIVLDDGYPVGCAIYAPPSAVPRAGLFPTSPVSADAVLLTTLRVEKTLGWGSMAGLGDEGLANELVQAVVRDLVRRGVRAVEAFGIRRELDPLQFGEVTIRAAVLPSATAALECSPESCMIEADFLAGSGFELIAPHHRFPRFRLEINRDHGWKEDVEYALEQLLAAAQLTTVGTGSPTAVGAN